MKKTKNITPYVASGAPVTYAELLGHLSDRLWGDAPRDGQVPNQVRNVRTQVNAWLQFVGKTLADEIGSEFGSDFDETLKAFAAEQTKLGRKLSVVRDRSYAISRFRAAYRRLATSALPSAFSAAVDLLLDRSGLSCNEVARRTGITATTLGLWRCGKATPHIRHNRVAELEEALGVAQDTLGCRLPRMSLPTNVEVLEQAPTTRYRQHMRELALAPQYSLKMVTEDLREEWRQLVRYKTSALPEAARHPRAVWRVKPAHMCRVLQPLWCHELPGGKRIIAAHIAWTHVAQYLGWLTLREDEGGAAVPLEQVQTLAWLALPQFVEKFLRWSAERSGAFNSHTLAYLNTACSLLSPETGYFNRSESLRLRLPPQWRPKCEWRVHCARAYKLLDGLRSNLAPSVQVTRDPESAIREILARPDPLTPLLQMLEAMELAMPPLTAPHDRALMMRDILLVALLIANPLRIAQYMTMQIGSGTDENLYKDAGGRWCIRFVPEHIKNTRFRSPRQKARDYNVRVAPWVVPMLDRYLNHGRPLLLKGQRSPYLLIGQLGRHADLSLPFSNLDDRLQLLTARFIPGSPGFRGHAFRHIVATAWLKAHPRDYLTVARMLGDKLETVIEVYAHLEIGDCLDDYSAWVGTLMTR